jgi:hypothetical protein
MRAHGIVLSVLLIASTATADLLYSPEGNRLRRYDIDSIKTPPLRQDVLIERASSGGLDINGMVCLVPGGDGRFIAGEDTGQPTIPPGWGVFEADGTRVGKLAATYFVSPGDPFGCVFDSQGRLFTTEIGIEIGGAPNGQLIMWFPPYDRFPGAPGTYPNAERSTNFCKISSALGTPTSIAIDDQDRIYVTSARASGFAGGGSVVRFSPPYPTSPGAAGGCGQVDALGSPVADGVQGEAFIVSGTIPTPTGIARARNGNWYVASVLNGVIGEFDPSGALVRRVLTASQPGLPTLSGNPQGLAVDADGDLYFADLQLTLGPGGIGPGPGKVRWIHFDDLGNPAPPRIIRERLAFPDALAVLPGSIAPCTENCPPLCPGDCSGSGMVTVDELVIGVNIALEIESLAACPALNIKEDARITIDELMSAIDAALDGCPTE